MCIAVVQVHLLHSVAILTAFATMFRETQIPEELTPLALDLPCTN